jgi:uncharacterized protein
MSIWLANVAEIATSDDGWEAMAVGDGSLGEVYWLRREEGNDRSLHVGVWRSREDLTFEYPFEGHESWYVIQGHMRLEHDSGEIVDLGPGDAASFAKGSSSRGSLKAPFLEFFIIHS